MTNHLHEGTLLALIDGRLGRVRRWWSRRHLRGCEVCREEALELRNLLGLLDNRLTEHEPSASERLDGRARLLEKMRTRRPAFAPDWTPLLDGVRRCVGSTAADRLRIAANGGDGHEMARSLEPLFATFVGSRAAARLRSTIEQRISATAGAC